MNPKEEVIKLIEDLPDDASIEDIIKELHVWTKMDSSIQLTGNEKTSSQRRAGRWLN